MTADPPACWVCDDTPHLCRCPRFGPEFHVVDSDVGPQYAIPLDP